MLPLRFTSGEIKVGYYIIAVPKVLKVLSFFSFLGLLIIAPLYYNFRLHKQAVLTFNVESIYIHGKKINLVILKENIGKIFCNDLKNLSRKSKKKLQIVIIEKLGKTTTFRLKNYHQAEELMMLLSKETKSKISFYENNMLTEYDQE